MSTCVTCVQPNNPSHPSHPSHPQPPRNLLKGQQDGRMVFEMVLESLGRENSWEVSGTNIAMVKPWPIEIDGLPFLKMGDIFHGYVKWPDGIFTNKCDHFSILSIYNLIIPNVHIDKCDHYTNHCILSIYHCQSPFFGDPGSHQIRHPWGPTVASCSDLGTMTTRPTATGRCTALYATGCMGMGQFTEDSGDYRCSSLFESTLW